MKNFKTLLNEGLGHVKTFVRNIATGIGGIYEAGRVMPDCFERNLPKTSFMKTLGQNDPGKIKFDSAYLGGILGLAGAGGALVAGGVVVGGIAGLIGTGIIGSVLSIGVIASSFVFMLGALDGSTQKLMTVTKPPSPPADGGQERDVPAALAKEIAQSFNPAATALQAANDREPPHKQAPGATPKA